MAYQPGAFPETGVYDGRYTLADMLPTGKWNVMANGRIYQLSIHGVSSGHVKGELTSGTFRDGFYDAQSGTLRFTRLLEDNTPQYWSGLLMYRSAKDTSHRIAGTIHQPNLAPSTANGGWYATLAAD